MTVKNPFCVPGATLVLPECTDIYEMIPPRKLENPETALQEALANPTGTRPLWILASEKRIANPEARAVIVISDNTRPVPYKGKTGILLPLLFVLLNAGYTKKSITILIANGTHRPLGEKEIETLLGVQILELGIPVVNHDCTDETGFTYLGKTARGSEVKINSLYMNADLKILTGLVESHFMAGVSGGRKSICPGLISESGTYIFHSAELMAHPQSTDLNLDGNPVHEESLAFARMAGADFIVNVTLDASFQITGIFAGDLEQAHYSAFKKIASYARIPVKNEADIVITHGGFVGINHYQSAKAAFAALGAIKKDGWLIEISNFTDPKNNIGSQNYQTMLKKLCSLGSTAFTNLLQNKNHQFVPDQWQVQKWATVFEKIPFNHYFYFAPQLSKEIDDFLPGQNCMAFFPKSSYTLSDYSEAIQQAVSHIMNIEKKSDLRITWLADGPYAIPYQQR